MSSKAQPQFTLYTNAVGPNGWKVSIILEELGLSYEPRFLSFDKKEQKSKEHLALNINGRIPTLIDHHNDDFTLWESGAIIEYLIGKYDKSHSISFEDFESQCVARQWLFFQVSGQGPYYGQAVYFVKFWPHPVPDILERYQNETKRVLGVLETALTDKQWIMGDKYSFVDAAFYHWNTSVDRIILPGEKYIEKNLPNVDRWMKALEARPAVKKIIADKAHYLPIYGH